MTQRDNRYIYGKVARLASISVCNASPEKQIDTWNLDFLPVLVKNGSFLNAQEILTWPLVTYLHRNAEIWFLSTYGWLVIYCRFKEGDAFVGYQKDVAAAVVFQASSQLRKTCEGMRRGTRGRQQAWEIAWKDGLLGHGSVDQLSREEEGSELWTQAVRGLVQSTITKYGIIGWAW